MRRRPFQRFARVARPLLARLLQQAAHERFDRGRRAVARSHERKRLRVLRQMADQSVDRVRTREGRLAAEQLVHQHAERVQIALRAGRLAAKLLG